MQHKGKNTVILCRLINIRACRACRACIVVCFQVFGQTIGHAPLLASDTTLTSQKFFSENFSLRIKIVL